MRINARGWYVPDVLLPGEPDPVESQWDECMAQIDAAVKHVHGRGLALQAGGRVGLWPRSLSAYFGKVVTLEPDPVNFECLSANIALRPNIAAFEAALGRRKRTARLTHSTLSSGEHYIACEHGKVPWSVLVRMIDVDTLMLEEGGELDAIFLDVEGYEIEALEGARRVLREQRPTLILEENNLCRRYGFNRGMLAKWLAPFGYRLVDEFTKLAPEIQNDGHWRGADLIFKAIG